MLTRFAAVAALVILPSVASTAQEPPDAIVYRLAEYSVQSTVSPEAGSRPTTMEWHWSYPVVLKSKSKATNSLNAWLRKLSLGLIATCTATPLTTLQKQSDREVLGLLSNHRDLEECGVGQSMVILSEAFGHYITAVRSVEWMGATRPQQGVETLTFNLKDQSETPMESLFKPDALAALNEILADELHRTKPNCTGQTFSWSQVKLRPPDEVCIEYPYNPADWRKCGDGVEYLHGPAVSAQLKRPSELAPRKKLVQVQ